MTAETITPGKLEIGRVIQQTFAVLGRNFATFIVLALLLSGIPTGIISYLQAAGLTGGANGALNLSPGYFTSLAVGGLAAFITAAILQGALIYGTVQDMNGSRPDIGDSLATGLRAFLPLLGVSILLGLGIAFGLILLVVPGFMVLCAWCVAVPALVAERTGVFGAFRRSAELTRGNRWRIFGLLVLVWIVAVVISAVIGGIIGGIATGMIIASGEVNPVAMARSPAQIAVNVVINTITSAISATGVAVLYVELRKAREGLGPQRLAEIFA